MENIPSFPSVGFLEACFWCSSAGDFETRFPEPCCCYLRSQLESPLKQLHALLRPLAGVHLQFWHFPTWLLVSAVVITASVLIVLGQIVEFGVAFPTLAFSSLGNCITAKSLLFLSPFCGVIELFWIKLTAVCEVQMTRCRKFSSNFRTG